jgi:glycosyltransferase involved in cell wall biosynthesis
VPEVTQWIQQREGGYDAIYVRYLQTALLAGLDHRNPAQRPQVIVDVDDVDWLTLESRFGAQPWPGVVGGLGMALALRTVRTRCTRALPAFNGSFVTSEIDVQEMRRWGQEPLLLANIPHPETIASNAPRPTPPPAGSRSVLFVGDLEFGPNATGLEWFLRECWPLIRSGVGDAQLRIVGRGLSEHQRQEWSKAPGVTVVGFADDLRDEYARCACTIGPTWWGGGTKIKVVESAAMGRACVATPHAVRGFEYLARGPAPGIIVAGDAREFASAVVRLLDDPDRRGKMGNSAMILAAWHSNLETFRRPVAEMQERLEEELRTAR